MKPKRHASWSQQRYSGKLGSLYFLVYSQGKSYTVGTALVVCSCQKVRPLSETCRNASNYVILGRDSRAPPTPTRLWKLWDSQTPKTESQSARGTGSWGQGLKRRRFIIFLTPSQMSELCNRRNLSGTDTKEASCGRLGQGEALHYALCGACDALWAAEWRKIIESNCAPSRATGRDVCREEQQARHEACVWVEFSSKCIEGLKHQKAKTAACLNI